MDVDDELIIIITLSIQSHRKIQLNKCVIQAQNVMCYFTMYMIDDF